MPLSAAAKAYNQMPKPNFKKQKRKAEEAKNRTVTKLGCDECGITDQTLYKRNGKYYCSKHLPD